MKIQKISGGDERQVLTGMIVNSTVLGRIAGKWEEDLFASHWANIIGGMCIEYYRKYQEAPGASIEGLFRMWAEGRQDKETILLLERFLESLSGEYEALASEINPDFLSDVAGSLFNKVRLKRLSEIIEGHIDLGREEEALKSVTSFRRVEIGVGAGIDLFQSPESIKGVFNKESTEALVTYPGDLGKFFGEQLSRNAFVAFMGPEGSGKSWWLLDVAWHAMTQRKRVAFFDCGDMTEEQVEERFLVRAAKHPLHSQDGSWPYEVKVPCELRTGEEVDVDYKVRTFDHPLTEREAWQACQDVMKYKVKSKKSYFRLSCHPSGSISVNGVASILSAWAVDGWMPDVVILDYADIMAPINLRAEKLDQINDTWQAMRRLSQELHILLVTATQANRESYKARTIRMEHTGGDKRKLAHVTSMFGINATDEEREAQVQRLNCIKRRKGASSIRKCVHVANCLALANPAVKSSF